MIGDNVNDRIFEINNMLLELASKTKNQGVLSENEIYNYLVYDKTETYFVNDEEENKVWKSLINKLDKPKGNIGFYRELPGWLTIRSKEFFNSAKAFKLYVNLPSEYIEKYSIKIFKFLDKKKIKNISKISDSIRTDGLVIRLSDINDARKVIEYINKICSKVASKTNPFTYRIQNVGIGYDGKSSYNSFISSIISKYLEYRYTTNTLIKVSYGDFKSYCEELYRNYFVNKSELNSLKETNFYQRELERLTNESILYKEQYFLVNVESMFKIFISSLNENANTNDVLGYILDLQDDKYISSRIEEFSKILNNTQNRNNNIQNNNENLKELLDDYTKFAIKKYGLVQAKKQLKAFMEDMTRDRYVYITSSNNFRQRFRDVDMLNNIHTLIQNVDSYCDSLNKIDYTSLTDILNSYIEYVGKDEAIKTLSSLQKDENYSVILDEYREQFINLEMANKIQFITENNLVEYIQTLLNKQNNNGYKI